MRLGNFERARLRSTFTIFAKNANIGSAFTITNMKQAISIFLTVLVLLMVVQPTLAFHYCGDTLRYVKVLAEVPVNSCCSGAGEYANMHVEEGAANEYLFLEHAKGCCSSYIIEMSTDDFKLQQESKIDRGFVAVDHPLVLNFLSSVLDSSIDPAAINLQRFSPGDTFHERRELLSLICTFLI